MKRHCFLFAAFLIAVALLPGIGQAQTDSAKYYRREMDSIYKKVHDSLLKDPEVIRLQERLDATLSHSDRYGSFVLHYNLVGNDLAALNRALQADGFGPIKQALSQVGYGFSFKGKKLVTDILFSLGFSNKTKHADETVKLSLLGFSLDFGYDLTRSNMINVYPYAGLSAKTSTLEYKKPSTPNTNATSIRDLLMNVSSSKLTNSRLGYQAGIGADFVLGPRDTDGFILFVKGGIGGTMGTETFSSDDIKYSPSVKTATWCVSVGFKFFGRR